MSNSSLHSPVRFPIHSMETAPQASRPVLLDLQQSFGMIPNIAGAMAESPVLIQAFIGLFRAVHGGTFSEAQIQVLLLTNAVTNACEWAVAFHTALALSAGIAAEDVHAIRDRRAPHDDRAAALSTFARHAIEHRGRVDDDDLEAFVRAGFERHQALEAVTVLAASTITNYTGNLARPPLEAAFQQHAWRRPA